MKISSLINSLLLALIVVNVADAALYKGLDSEGNIFYADKPFDNAKRYKAEPISVVETPGAKKNIEADKPIEPAKKFKYMAFDILSPKADETIRNEDVSVVLRLDPGLNAEENHSIWMLVDGKAVVKNTQSFSLELGKLNRGMHKLQAQVRNEKGEIIVRTRTTVVFIHQTAAN